MKLKLKFRGSEAKLAYLLLIPTLVFMASISFYPLANAFYSSFRKGVFYKLGEWIGLTNYINLFHKAAFWESLTHTLYFVLVSIILEFVLGLAIALALNKRFHGRGIVRASILIPWAIPTAVCAKIFLLFYNPDVSVLNDLLLRLHLIAEPIGWITDPSVALMSCIFLDVWKTTPFVALLLLAGLQVIPKDLYNAAKVDGAGPWKCFRNITLPLLTPAILVALIFRSLDAFKVYDSIWVLTRGGPAGSTEVMSSYAYKQFFSYPFDFGTGCAVSVITFLCVLILSFFYIKGMGKQME
jgi:multiple sugar transport system permease protein